MEETRPPIETRGSHPPIEERQRRTSLPGDLLRIPVRIDHNLKATLGACLAGGGKLVLSATATN